MGLFDKLRKSVTNVATESKDTREPAPMDVLEYRQQKCITVKSVNYCQDAIKALGPGEHDVIIRKPKNGEWGDYVVRTTDGQMLGCISERDLMLSGYKNRGTVRAIVCEPKYMLEEWYSIYIPRTDEGLELEDKLDSLKKWISISDDHWYGPDDERVDYYDAEWMLSADKKPTITLMVEGKRVFDVTSRMRCYADVSERTAYTPRRVICERKVGDHGPYHSIGLYF